MTQKRATKRANNSSDGPYRRMGILVAVSVAIIVLLFGVSLISKGFGGNERRLAEAFIETMQKPHVNGEVDISHQSQVSSFDIRGKMNLANREALMFDGTVTLGEQDEAMEIPLDAYADFGKQEYYLQVKSTDALVRSLGEMMPQLNADLISVSEKIDGKWLKYSLGEQSSPSCSTQIIETLQTDEDAIKEVTRTYMSNRFITVNSLDRKGESTEVYDVSFDGNAISTFGQKLYTTNFVKNIEACEDAVKQAESQPAQSSPSQQQSEDMTKTIITVKDGVIVDVTVSSAVQANVTSVSLALDFAENNPTAPTENIVESSRIENEMRSISTFIVEQQAAAQQQAAPNPMMQMQQ